MLTVIILNVTLRIKKGVKMEKKRQRRKTGTDLDRFMITTTKEMGQMIRNESAERGLSLSKFIGDIFEDAFNNLLKKEGK